MDMMSESQATEMMQLASDGSLSMDGSQFAFKGSKLQKNVEREADNNLGVPTMEELIEDAKKKDAMSKKFVSTGRSPREVATRNSLNYQSQTAGERRTTSFVNTSRPGHDSIAF